MSGTTDKSKGGGNFGTLLLLVVLNLLETLGFSAWDMGMSISYKLSMGAKNFPRTDFLAMLHKNRNKCRYFGFQGIRRANCQAAGVPVQPVKDNQVSLLEIPLVQGLFLELFKQRLLNRLRQRQRVFAKRIPQHVTAAFRSKSATAAAIREYLSVLCHHSPSQAEALFGGTPPSLAVLVGEVQKVHESELLKGLSRKQRKRLLLHFRKKFSLVD